LFDDLSSVSDDVILSDLDTGASRLGFLFGSIVRNRRGSLLNLNSGYIVSADLKLASEMVGSEADFVALGGRWSTVYPVPYFRRWSVAGAVRSAASWGYGDTEQIPITQRYLLGGLNSIRGFREDSLGPRGEEGGVIGGDLLLASNLELRYKLSEMFSLLTFFDAGSVFLQDQSFDTSEIREGVGAGVRYISPIGPIGFDIGHPLDERDGEPSVRFHFTIGANF